MTIVQATMYELYIKMLEYAIRNVALHTQT